MGRVSTSLPSLSIRRVERGLAVLLVGLLGTYALRTLSSGAIPVLDGAGVLAVHLAVLVGVAFPFAVLSHGLYGTVRSDRQGPRRVETLTAAVALGSLLASLWIGLEPSSTLDTPLIAVAGGASLLLVGLVVARPASDPLR